MPPERPHLIVLAGPNGAGKRPFPPICCKAPSECTSSSNADTIARGLSEFNPEGAAIEAGRVMLRRLHHLTAQRLDVAFETTLASRSFAPWIRELKTSGYDFHLFFISLPTPEVSIGSAAACNVVAIRCPKKPFGVGSTLVYGIFSSCISRSQRPGNSTITSIHPGLRLIAMGGAWQTDVVEDVDRWRKIEAKWKR